MVTVPKLTPFTCGVTVGVVLPCVTRKLGVDTVTRLVLLLTRVMMVPPDGAGVGKETVRLAWPPTFTVTPLCRMIPVALLVSENAAGVPTPGTVALTL